MTSFIFNFFTSMVQVIHTPSQPMLDGGSGVGLAVIALVIVIIAMLFFFFVWPMLRTTQTPTTVPQQPSAEQPGIDVNVPEEIDVHFNPSPE